MNTNDEIIFSALNHEHDKDDENVLNRQKLNNKLREEKRGYGKRRIY